MATTSLVPLLVLFAVVAGLGWFGYQVYLYSNQLADKGRQHLEERNISFTDEGGMKVGVQQRDGDEIEDSTQSVLVKTWNLANESKAASRTSSQPGKPAASRTTSSART